MAKQLNVNLAFTADTSQAKASLQDLQNQLSRLSSMPININGSKMAGEIRQASDAALELQTHLKNAMNPQTGTLDFTKLNTSIQKSGTTLAEYGRKLQQLGPAGQQAFMSLASAVSQAEIPIRRSNTALSQMMVTLKNTARWQLSSSMLHGFMSAVQSAYGYAQDLNESLNKIRIVTGQNIDQMAKFAEKANQAARALSTTTTDYTDASLIYYQQGLSDSEVEKRTAVTIKMANAAGQSAQIVSDPLTAGWNNFYEGSKSWEYYADVMTALGAATASSTDEIAGGLEKFAAIADTIGLSYEYAASALATITANTRQSEEVVGTALKTIFARIQGLNLGETLEDGTTLNKYSEALQKVGISIFDQNGELKKMDNILNEMGSKWNTLNNAQQTALAQTVAGVRQYNQLISLMDNWDSGDSDSMMANLKTSYNATGTLQKQADIYAESWEAAQDRVRAAAEGIFSSLMDEDFFIGALKGIEKILTGVDRFIDSLGGLKGVLSTVGVLLTKTFSEQMAQGLRNMAHNVYMSTEGGRKAAAQAKINTIQQWEDDMKLGVGGTGGEVGAAASKQHQAQLAMQRELMANAENMSQDEIANAQRLLDIRKQIGEEIIKAKQQEAQGKDKVWENRIRAIGDMGSKTKDGIVSPDTMTKLDKYQEELKEVEMAAERAQQGLADLSNEINQSGSVSKTTFEALKNSLLGDADGKGGLEVAGFSKEELQAWFDAIEEGGPGATAALKELTAALAGKSGSIQNKMTKELKVSKDAVDGMKQGYRDMARGALTSADATDRAAEAQQRYSERIKSAKGVVKDWANSLVSGAQAVMSFASILSSATSMIETLTNPDATGWEKFMAVLQSGSMIMMMTVSMFNSLAMAQKNWQKGTLKNAASTLIEAAATSLSTKANEQNARAQMKKAAGHNKDANAALKDAAATEIEGKVTEKNNKSLGKSFKDLGKSIGDYAKAFKTQIAGGVIIAASIALIIGTITAATNQYNEAANNAENAAKAAEQLANQYQSVKENYDGFISTAKGYEEIVEGMKGLTKGTAEYNEQLLKANNYAMDLINKYDLIGKYSIQGGLIVFDEGALEDAQMQQLDALGKAQASSYMGQVASSHFTGESNQTNLNRDINTVSDNGINAANVGVTTAAGGLAGAGIAVGGAMLAGATIGSSVPVIGTIIGAVVGLIAGIVTTAVVGAESKAENEALNNLTKYVSKNGDGIFAAKDWETFDKMLTDAQLEIKDKELVKSLYANRDAVRELTLAEVARLEREEANFEAGFAAYNMNNAQYTGLEVGQGYLNEQASNYREENIDAVRTEVSDLWSGSNDDFWAKYLQYIYGQKDIDVDNTSGENVRIVDLGGGAVTVEKKNEDGIWETYGNKDGLDEDVAQEQLVNAILLERASAAMDFDTLNSLVEKLISAGLSLEEDSALMDSILAQYADGGKINLSNFKYSDLTKINLDALDGPMRDAVSEAITAYENGMSAKAKEIANSDWYKNLTPEQQDLVWDIQIDEYQTIDSVKAALEASQAYIDANRLTTSIDVQSAIVKAYQDGDMATFKELYNDENSPYKDQMSYEQFLEMDPEDAFRFLETGATELSEAYEVNQDAIDANTKAINEAKGALDRANEAAYGADGKEDGVGGTDQGIVDAKAYEQETRDALTNFDSAVGYNPNATSWDIVINDATGEAEGGRYNLETNKVWGTTGILGWKHSGYEAYSTVDTVGSMQAALGPLEQLLGANSPFYQGISQYVQYAEEAQNSEYGMWSDEAWNWITNTFGPMLAAEIAKSPEYDYMREANWSEAEIIDSILNNYLLSDLYQGQYEGIFASENAAPLYSILDAARSFYQNEVIGGAEEGVAKAERTHEEAEEAAGKNGVAQQNLDTYEAERTKLLENWHQQNQRFQAEIEDLGFGADIYEEMKRQLVATNEELEGQEGLLHNLAKAQLRVDRGSTKMAEKQKDWKEVIEESNGEGSAYLETVLDIRDAYADVFDLDPSVAALLSAEFLTSAENMDLMTEALAGNDAAWDQWKANVANQIVDSVVFDKGLSNVLDEVIDKVSTYDFGDIEIGASLEDAPFWDALSQMEIGSVEAANAITDSLSSMGVDAELEKHEVTVPPGAQTTTKEGYYEYVDNSDPINPVTKTIPINSTATQTEEGTTYTWYTLKGAKYNGKGVSPPTPPKGGNTGGGGGGGGSKPKKTSDARKKKTDFVDRYKEINDQLEETQRAMKKNATLADSLWGSERIEMLKNNIKLLEKEYKLLQDRAELTQDYLEEDTDALQEAIGKFGYKFNIDDETKLITNYTEIMEKVYQDREQLLHSFGAEMDEAEQERLADFDKWVEELKSAYEQYETTVDEAKDAEEQRLEKLLEIQTAYYDKLNEELEVNLSINEDDLSTIEYYLNKMADDFYKMAEAAALMVGSLEKLMAKQFGGQAQSYLSNLDYYKDYMDQLEHDYTTINPETGETYINKQQYIEGMREAKAGIIENLQALNELDQAMMNYYENTLAAGAEELAKYTDVMESQTGVLEHYANIMGILGKEKDYEGMGVILDAQAKTLANEVAVAEANYNMLRNQADLRKQAYEEAKARGASESELELLKNEWWAAENAASEAQDAMLAKTEAWAEAMKAVIENKLNGLAQSLENALTGDFGGSFEAMTNRLERANSLQEEFLTTTNQIYETNKLMRTAQQEIDKSTNSVAKRKLKSFIDETEQLQNQTKLSQYELDIQQAKYDLLLAEIALSEASNAKSTVRLQRDSEGNFGYVYTADTNAIEEAEQQFEDAQNRLYNIGLDGANQYTEKYQQTLAEFYDTMTELQTRYLNGEFENEAEYQEAMETARKYYYEKLQQYSSLYSIALTTDARVVEDAWSTEFQNMTLNTNQWMKDVNGYVSEVGKVFQEWGTIQKTVADKTIGPSLDALKTKTEDIVTASTNLVGIITGENGVLAGLEQEYNDVTNLTGAYASLRQEMLDAIGAHEQLIEEIDQNIKNADNKETKTEDPPKEDPPKEDPPKEDPPGGEKNYDAKTKRGVALAIWNGGYGWGTGKTRRNNLAAKGFDPDEIQNLVNNTNPNGGWEKRYGITDLSQYAFSKFDTGGYTGSWAGSYGKLAMLHQKELVLNEGDTANFLAGMEFLDKIVSMIDLYSANAQLGGVLSSPSFSSYGSANEVLEQNVHIEASFPGVSDRHEIEEALNTLVNRASQFAGRK